MLKPPGMWTDAEDSLLQRGIAANHPIEFVAETLKRPVKSLEARLAILQGMRKRR